MEIIFLLISIIGFLGLMTVILKKLPDLASLNVKPRDRQMIFFQNIKMILSGNGNSKPFFGAVLLQKILSKIRIIVLKIECKIGERLENLRLQTNQKKKDFSDNYWRHLKKKE
jgi:hypothetical protein